MSLSKDSLRTFLSIHLVAIALGGINPTALFAQSKKTASRPAPTPSRQHRVARATARTHIAAPLPEPSAPLPLTLEQARETALANNRQLQLGHLNLAEKQLAASAAAKDYFPKAVAFGTYLHFNDDLGTVLATRDRSLGGAT